MRPFIHCLYFICERKFYPRTHIKITRQWKSSLNHSTETAFIRVHNDIAMAIDQHNSVILVLLDLSAAFDTVDHGILLSRLSNRFGITGTVLEWFRSYLSDRTQFVQVNGACSASHVLEFGVPQALAFLLNFPFLSVSSNSTLPILLREKNSLRSPRQMVRVREEKL